MKMQQLLEREPFPQVFKQTMAWYWSQQHQQEYRVYWSGGRKERERQAGPGQVWVCNTRLNAVWAQGHSWRAVSPVRRDLGVAVTPWKRPLSRAYAWVASTGPMDGWLTPLRLWVHPAVPRARELLIGAGNTKLRVFDAARRQCTAIAKQGFDTRWLTNEIEGRRLAHRFALAVPRLYAAGSDGRWFVEECVAGTPVNRISCARRRDPAIARCLRDVQVLAERTARECGCREYLDGLLNSIGERLQRDRMLGTAARDALRWWLVQVDGLVEREGWSRRRLVVSTCHGDFALGNILAGKDGCWLVDWEWSRTAQAGYDGLHFALRPSEVALLPQRFRSLVQEERRWQEPALACWPGLTDPDPGTRRLRLLLFLLERLEIRLQSDINPLFFRPDAGLTSFLQQLPVLLQALETA